MLTNDAPLTAPLDPKLDNTTEKFRIALAEQLAVPNRQQLKMRVVDAIAEGHVHIVLDGSACGYIDTSGLGVLVSISKKCRDAGGSLEIQGLSREMREYFAIIHLDTLFTLTDAPAT